eukprot:CAMPEP_0206140148 /NCGR_PEP_ID=MMETSP1473-20131121/8600_1 /ASSEMBLY_ACC=CAM_ASM_001109 /TAXON_ID=1461547 /ORGANISM="Stichococcus sp, Strain RCC1054" /LENGTH=322 /DNA_ID=CAMNT_0053534205 /DNA_START=173 /DNA_END=1141 /DNA_ORIENTATION=-
MKQRPFSSRGVLLQRPATHHTAHHVRQRLVRSAGRCRAVQGDQEQIHHPRQITAGQSRRASLLQLAVLPALLDTGRRLLWPQEAQASLVQFPADALRNNYYLVRAGESQAEAAGYVLSNPVAKTSMDSGLTELGKRQVVRGALEQLKKAPGFDPDNVYFWPSITQRAYQTAEIMGSLLGVGRSRIVPEFSFLDPRGLGALEGYSLQEAAEQLNNGDRQSPNWKPLRNYDGTPNESVSDVLVRMRQVVSITESQWSNASIVIISPDSDLLSVLQAAAVGVDLRDHRRFAFGPGECRRLQLATELPVATKANTKYSCPNPPICQ